MDGFKFRGKNSVNYTYVKYVKIVRNIQRILTLKKCI